MSEGRSGWGPRRSLGLVARRKKQKTDGQTDQISHGVPLDVRRQPDHGPTRLSTVRAGGP